MPRATQFASDPGHRLAGNIANSHLLDDLCRVLSAGSTAKIASPDYDVPLLNGFIKSRAHRIKCMPFNFIPAEGEVSPQA